MNTRIPELPELSDATIDRMEQKLLARIAEERSAPASARRARARSRGRTWMTVGGVAAAFAAGILVAPPLMNAMTSHVYSSDLIEGAAPMVDGSWSDGDRLEAPEVAPPMGEPHPLDGTKYDSIASQSGERDGAVTLAQSERAIIANANASVRVNEIAAASDAIAQIAEGLGGYVESTNLGQSHRSSEGGGQSDIAMPYPPGGDWGWITIRVPSTALNEAISKLSGVGEVRSSALSKQDVTTVAIDLRARVEATRASVERLTELMSRSESVSELIEAEMALSDRQAELESYQQQLRYLDEQVAMSTLHVELERIMPVTKADPAGFGDGFVAGWNGMMVSLNALVVALGFIIPWAVVLGVIALIIWFIVRGRRRSRTATAAE